MAHPYHHSLSSVKKWGGKVEDYLPIHNWFDASKSHLADFRHRALRHHAEGIFWAEEVFGVTITNSDGKVVPVRMDRRTACETRFRLDSHPARLVQEPASTAVDGQDRRPCPWPW